MQNDMRNRLANLLYEAEGQVNNEYPTIEMIADYLIANGVIVPPCEVGETLYLVQINHKGDYSMTPIVVGSKITMLSILRAYEEKTIIYMSTDKEQAEQKLKEMRVENG